MSISIIQQPAEVTLSTEAALYIVEGSDTSGANYRYVAEVKDSEAQTLGRYKCDKLPNNRGFFNVAKVIETLVPIQKPSFNFYANPLISLPYTIDFKEEYGTPPAIVSGVTTASGVVLSGYKREWQSFTPFNYYGSGDSKLILSNKSINRVITPEQPDFVAVMISENGTLRASITYPLRGTFNVDTAVAANQYAAQLNLGLASISAIPASGTSDGFPGSYQAPGWNNTLEYDFYNDRCEVDGAVSEGNDCAFGIFNSLVDFNDGDSYNVEVLLFAAGDQFFYAVDRAGEAYTVDYTLSSCQRFTDQIVYFRNALGGVDSYTFTMKNRKRGEIERRTYGRNTDIYGTSVAETIYAGEFTEILTLNSDWLAQSDSEWLKEMIYSPQVWLYIDGELIEAIVQTSTYQYFTKPQDKLAQIQVDVAIAYKNKVK